MLEDDDFVNTASVDRYGRRVSTKGRREELERLYDLDGEEEDVGTEENKGEGKETQIEIEDDEVIERELMRVVGERYDPARGGGFSSSSEDNDDDEDGRVEISQADEEEFPDMQAEQVGVEMGEVSSRFAVVNLDWDNIKSIDLMAVFSSFVASGGKIHKISIYPSEFGMERMEREVLEVPPKEIFAKNEEEVASELDSEDDSEDVEELEEDLQREYGLLEGPQTPYPTRQLNA